MLAGSKSGGHGGGHGGGSVAVHIHGHGSSPDASKKKSNTKEILLKAMPYVWPTGENSLRLRIQFIFSIICLVLGNLGDLITPIAMKYAVDDLSQVPPAFPVHWMIAYGGVRCLAAVFQQLRDVLFAEVSAQTERKIALEVFNHLQSLSLSFHLRRETGAVLRSVSRGAQSFGTLARILIFQIAPVFFQVAVVCIYLLVEYAWYYAFLTFGIIVFYMAYTFITTNWRDKFRRTMNDKDNEFNQKSTDALLNFETVKYFNAEKHEEIRYDGALSLYTQANIKVQRSLAVLNAGQSAIISIGILLTMILAGLQVRKADISVGDWVLMVSFIQQLYTPLNFLGTYYRIIKQSIIDVESMFALLSENSDIIENPDASELQLSSAEITFDNVSFAYDPQVPILKNVSFTVKPGQKVAIVGASGAGKSTIARLLYRFYDPTSGRVLIDGQPINSVTQNSLRREIAIVPQDTVLFNDTIGYNIGYGIYGRSLHDATQQQIEDAARSASIYDFIMRQPQQFDTKVGERGLRLSGGEKQRVAIARAILKQPKIIVFDEATSALDSHTESEIQRELDLLSRGRSTITIAHRLSTIRNSDVIIVMDAGHISESGTHDELIAKNGLYTRMWLRQEKARELTETLEQIKNQEMNEHNNGMNGNYGRSVIVSSSSSFAHPHSTSSSSPTNLFSAHSNGSQIFSQQASSQPTSIDHTLEIEDVVDSSRNKKKKKKSNKGGLGAPLLGDEE